MVYNGVATKITPTINKNILTFETDKFSTYALAYTDINSTSNDSTTDISVTTTKGIINKSSNPETGDNVIFYVSMLGLSIIGLAGVGLYIKKKKI